MASYAACDESSVRGRAAAPSSAPGHRSVRAAEVSFSATRSDSCFKSLPYPWTARLDHTTASFMRQDAVIQRDQAASSHSMRAWFKYVENCRLSSGLSGVVTSPLLTDQYRAKSWMFMYKPFAPPAGGSCMRANLRNKTLDTCRMRGESWLPCSRATLGPEASSPGRSRRGYTFSLVP